MSSRCLPAPATAGVTGIHRAACSGARGWVDAGDKPRHDKRDATASKSSKPALLMGREP